MVRISRALSIAATAGWFASLLLPALSFRFDGEHDVVLEGYKVLTSGYYHLLVLEFSWLANFAFWFLVWVIWSRPERDPWLRAGAIVTIVLTAQSIEIFLFDRFFQFPRPFAGYFVWSASNLLIAMSALGIIRRRSAGFAAG